MPDHPKATKSFACPNCGKAFSQVQRTYSKEGEMVRYRRCLQCGSRFTTSEVPRQAATPKKKVARKRPPKKKT